MTVTKALLIASLFLVSIAHADTRGREVFAIVATNNHSSQLGRPDLRYADDDGAKYYEVFRMLAPAEHVHLLADFDRDTRGLFPKLVAVATPPTQRAVIDAAADVAKRARAALDAGKTVEVYFVFAGHGDVDRGAGFIELADGPFGAADLDKHVLSGIPSTHTHVILDSCNSFFVINARKPGGRRFATPNDITEAFAKKLPNVGVFLSTSAEQEVYEWSELQSGIFSHAVRSGILGAADADRDGSVSYRELQAFVTVAAAKVKNPMYRPHVFARGPAGKNDAALVDLSRVDAVKVSVGPTETRLTVRDREALPWIDAHTEAGATVELRIPPHALEGGIVEAGGTRRELQAGNLASLPEVTATVADARGPDSQLRDLFAEPFGPGAMAHVDLYIVPDEEVFGVTQEDGERMDLLLGAVADNQRSQRYLTGSIAIAGGLLLGGTLAYTEHRLDATTNDRGKLVYATSGALVLLGMYKLLSPSDGERIHEDFRSRMLRRHGDDALIVADTERRLANLANQQARMRRVITTVGWIELGLGAALVGSGELFATRAIDRDITRIGGGAIAVIGGLSAVIGSYMKTPEERIYGLWHDDPSIRRMPRLGLAPVPGGGMAMLGGSF